MVRITDLQSVDRGSIPLQAIKWVERCWSPITVRQQDIQIKKTLIEVRPTTEVSGGDWLEPS